MALGYSVSNAVMFPGIRYTGRLASDPLGLLPQGEGTIIDGGGSQTGSSRWGDYTTMAVDPADDCTFWYVNEYYAASAFSAWRTRVGSYRFPTCSSVVGVEDDAGRPVRTEILVSGPARGRASIVFVLAGDAERHVVIDVFDVSGRRVRRLVDTVLPGGRYGTTWDASSDAGVTVGSGVYFARLRAGDAMDSGTIMLLK
jgi:hypothetical protein